MAQVFLRELVFPTWYSYSMYGYRGTTTISDPDRFSSIEMTDSRLSVPVLRIRIFFGQILITLKGAGLFLH